MRCFFKLLMVMCAATLLLSCGGVEDKEGNSLQVGKQYAMTEDGLALVPHLTDQQGSPLEVGKEYVMTPNGLALIPYLKDKDGNRVEVGNEYVMTGQGLKLVLSRGIKGALVDYAGKPLSGVEVLMAGSDYKRTTAADGSFTFPFIEGYVSFQFNVPGLPEWCGIKPVENPSITRERYPDGWNLGTVKLPCLLTTAKNGQIAWATASGEYVDNGDGTISDLKHGLMWEAEVKKSNVSWNAAEQYASNLNLAGQSDWRLPSPDELEALYEAGIACAWSGPTVIRGALSLWSAEHVEDSALVVNICSGKSRKSSGLDEGPNVNSSVLAVTQLK